MGYGCNGDARCAGVGEGEGVYILFLVFFFFLESVRVMTVRILLFFREKKGWVMVGGIL